MSNNDNYHQKYYKLVQEQSINALPHDEEAEEVLLGSLLSDNSALDLIENGLADIHFLFQYTVNFPKYL